MVDSILSFKAGTFWNEPVSFTASTAGAIKTTWVGGGGGLDPNLGRGRRRRRGKP